MEIAHRRKTQDDKGDHGGGMKWGERSIYEVYKKRAMEQSEKVPETQAKELWTG